jgi:glycosyltransferase involved in cell wall biosynthesis
MSDVETKLKLFIYIPTFNRVTMAIEQLERLEQQISNFPNVRVLVSDNASDVGKPESIRSWCQTRSQFAFHSQPTNVGAEANFMFGYLNAEPDEHIWLLADDTVLEVGAVGYILENLKENDLFCPMTNSDERQMPTVFNFREQGLGHALRNYQWGLISSCIYNMRFIGSELRAGFEFHNSSFVHLGILFSALSKREETPLKWLRLDKIHRGNDEKLPSDYSLALVGSPLLYMLAPKWEQKTLSRSYLWRNAGGFIQAGKKHPMVFQQSKELLMKMGGLMAKAGYFSGFLEYEIRRSRFGRKIDTFIEQHPKLLAKIIRSGRLPFRIQ